jgi:hypothetical protein
MERPLYALIQLTARANQQIAVSKQVTQAFGYYRKSKMSNGARLQIDRSTYRKSGPSSYVTAPSSLTRQDLQKITAVASARIDVDRWTWAHMQWWSRCRAPQQHCLVQRPRMARVRTVRRSWRTNLRYRGVVPLLLRSLHSLFVFSLSLAHGARTHPKSSRTKSNRSSMQT